ncbi:sulfate transporter [Mycolicibacterium rhodesiae]|uniref:Sulfate transporter n=1 Tax=Mycolicibacterium rhodesiae TaxID=36814 RepID=A0A1X0IP81_MYCRH|nr:STAS domain-containing protein [Mycolicibacterium rhodesiae]ORB49686.1 sulfate transporter [Mycolicibacterium rhodesiae]
MSVFTTDQPERSAVSHSYDCHTARFTTIWPDETVGIITVQGELDASNAIAFADHVDACAAVGDRLVLDLSPLSFFGTAGFSALHTINVRCANASARWVMVTGEAVSRLLRVCDPDHTLPVADSVREAVELLDGEPRRLLQLVPEPS